LRNNPAASPLAAPFCAADSDLKNLIISLISSDSFLERGTKSNENENPLLSDTPLKRSSVFELKTAPVVLIVPD
jgi:hypothetical protein